MPSEPEDPRARWTKADREIANYNQLAAHLARGEATWRARPFHLEFALHELEAGRTVLAGQQLEEWLRTMERGSICGLGQAAPAPLRSAMRHWPEVFAPLR